MANFRRNITTKMSKCSFILVVIAFLTYTYSLRKLVVYGQVYTGMCTMFHSCFFVKAEEEKESEEAAKEDNQEEDGDKSKPVASQLIPGTSWCVVWTGDEKMFFFNPTTRLSIWEKPDELENNEKVDEIVNKGPPKRQPSTELSM